MKIKNYLVLVTMILSSMSLAMQQKVLNSAHLAIQWEVSGDFSEHKEEKNPNIFNRILGFTLKHEISVNFPYNKEEIPAKPLVSYTVYAHPVEQILLKGYKDGEQKIQIYYQNHSSLKCQNKDEFSKVVLDLFNQNLIPFWIALKIVHVLNLKDVKLDEVSLIDSVINNVPKEDGNKIFEEAIHENLVRIEDPKERQIMASKVLYECKNRNLIYKELFLIICNEMITDPDLPFYQEAKLENL